MAAAPPSDSPTEPEATLPLTGDPDDPGSPFAAETNPFFSELSPLVCFDSPRKELEMARSRRWVRVRAGFATRALAPHRPSARARASGFRPSSSTSGLFGTASAGASASTGASASVGA